MNRPLNATAALLLLTVAALPAAAQTPLIVGAVHDQHGAAVEGATVTGLRGETPPLQARTDAAGTFALAGSGIRSVRISCRYCSPVTAPVRPGEPVVVIVLRYDALLSDAPTQSDLENLPYAHVESAIGLRPFTLLVQSTTPYPGSSLSDRGLSPSGSLLVDDGNPSYDMVTGASPYAFVPAQYENSAEVTSASQAYRYGNQAGGGVVAVIPFGDEENWEVATLGSDTIARAQVGTDALGAAFGSFTNDEESRQRADLTAGWSLGPDQSLTVAAASEQGRSFGLPDEPFAGSFSFADATYADSQLSNLYVTATVDRGNAVMGTGPNALADAWSDAGFGAGVHSNGPVEAFADLGLRASSGGYDAAATVDEPYEPSVVGATFREIRSDAGVTASADDYDVTAGVGAFWLDYAGGPYEAQPVKAALALPSLQAQILPNGRWSGTLEAAASFTLPTFLEQYGDAYVLPTALEYQRNSFTAALLTYTDESRLRVSLEGASERIDGATSGAISSAGISATWQIAPLLAIRAWTMHVTDTAPEAYSPLASDTAAAPTEGAAWLTYDAAGNLRIDAIYRRDLLDGAPFNHLDGDVSGPVSGRLRWYAGIEDRLRRTFVDVGMRFEDR